MDDDCGPLRVFNKNSEVPGLAMTRSFGDLIGHESGIIHDSDFSQHALTNNDRALVLGSDGLFEFLDDNAVIKVIDK